MALISHIDPKDIEEALQGYSWVEAMQEELSQFEKNRVWTLVPPPKGHPLIEIIWYSETS